MKQVALFDRVRGALAGKYDVKAEVGRGGNARIYGALNAAGERLAIKVLHPELAATVTAQRFLREIDTLRQLQHPRLSRLLDSGEAGHLLYYVMPYIPGYNVREYLDRDRMLGIELAVKIGCEVLQGLEYAHAQGVAHRDIKPDNIVIGPEGAVIVDLGIARAIAVSGPDRVTRTGFVVGTDVYMSPEQTEETREIDGRTDIYSLGVVLYEMLTGHPPFRQGGPPAIMNAHRKRPAPDPRTERDGLPKATSQVVLKALAKARDERWQSAKAMESALRGSLGP